MSFAPLAIHCPEQGPSFEHQGPGSLLASAEAHGQAWPSSCRNGSCRACRCLAVQGEVKHLIEWPSLSPEEKREGWILPCVALPLTPLVLRWPRPGE